MSDHDAPAPIGQEPDPHFVSHAKEHLKLYLFIGCTLFFFTGFTIALAKVEFFDFGSPGVGPSDLIVGLLVATIKSSLVISIFMHLKGERALIYKFLFFTLVFVAGMVWLILLAQHDPMTFENFSNEELFQKGT